jgi:mRNA interferase RelE/StbE
VSYQIEFSRQADRQFRNLPSQIQQRLKSKIDSLVAMPRPHGSEKLSGVDQLYRVRVGDIASSMPLKTIGYLCSS